MSTPSVRGDSQHALLDAIFSHAPVGLGFWDAELCFQRLNDALAEINGLPVADHLGRTPSELLGALGVDAEGPLRRVLETGESVSGISHTGELPSQPGAIRHWLASYYPVLDPDGATVGVAAAVVEVTDQHQAEAERVALLKDAVTARAHAEAAQIRAEASQRRAEAARARTEFLAEAGRRMAISMDYETTLQEIAEIAVPVIADHCAITVARMGGRLERLAVVHVDPEQTRIARETMAESPPRRSDATGPGAVIRTGEPELVEDIDEEFLGGLGVGPEQRATMRASGLRATLIVPLKTPDGTIGAIAFAMSQSERSFEPEDVSLALGLAGRAALHVRNAQLYTERSHIARTLQAGLLPRSLPEIPGVEIAARHRAAGTANEVGGDFYDVFPTEDGAWTALIGDVTGKGPEAAAVTSLARHTLRTAALGERSPAANLHLLNRAMLADLDSTRFCTVVYARICPGRDGGALVTLACGGHPPPLVLRASGEVESVESVGTLVGGVADPDFTDVDVRLGPGDALCLYTDGVTELRTSDPAFGERRLRETLQAAAGGTAEEIAAAVEAVAVEAQGGRPRDDIALLILRITPEI